MTILKTKLDKNAKIYVAGHRGLVGSAIVARLKAEGFTNIITRTSQQLDLRRQEAVEEFFLKEKPNYVFLAAAKVGGIVANNTYKAEFIYENLMIASNVIHAAHISGVKKLLNLGSSCIYPKLAPQPLKEEYLLTAPLEPTNEPYAIAKIAAIKLCRYYNEQYGTDFISAMPTNLYGPNDNYNLETSHLLPALIRKFLLAKALYENDWEFIRQDIKSNPIGFKAEQQIEEGNTESLQALLKELGITANAVTLWGTGSPFREFLYSDDLAEACVFLMEKYSAVDVGECINIGTGEDQTIKETAEIIKRATGFKGDIYWDNSRPDGTPKKLQDVSRLQALGWKATTSLEEGIASVINLYKKSHHTSQLEKAVL